MHCIEEEEDLRLEGALLLVWGVAESLLYAADMKVYGQLVLEVWHNLRSSLSDCSSLSDNTHANERGAACRVKGSFGIARRNVKHVGWPRPYLPSPVVLRAFTLSVTAGTSNDLHSGA